LITTDPTSKGISGREYLERTKYIHISPDDLERMRQAIEDCERIDWDGWDMPTLFDELHDERSDE
jgi:hypothetical protein